MKPWHDVRFFLLVGIVGILMLSTLQQLAGTVLFFGGNRGDSHGAARLDTLQAARNFEPSHSYYWFSVGRVLENRGAENGRTLTERRSFLEGALENLQIAIGLEPTASLYHCNLGWVYEALSPYEPAARWAAHRAFTRATSLNPTQTDFRWTIANHYLDRYALLLKLEHDAKTGRELERVRRDFQRHFRVYITFRPEALKPVLDRLYTVTQRYDDLKGVIPDKPQYHLALARFLDQRGMWDPAREEFELTIDQDPENPDAHYFLGSTLFEHNRHDEAIRHWKRQQEINPQDPRSYIALSKAFWAIDQREEAIAELNRLVTRNPEHLQYRLLLATRLEDAGRFDEALQ